MLRQVMPARQNKSDRISRALASSIDIIDLWCEYFSAFMNRVSKMNGNINEAGPGLNTAQPFQPNISGRGSLTWVYSVIW